MPKPFITACKDFFGLLPGQSPVQFGKELLAMSAEFKKEVFDHLSKIGVDCEQPAARPAAA